MTYLLDTNVISEFRKDNRSSRGAVTIDPNVKTWVTSVSRFDLYLSVMSILELEIGRLLLARRDPAQAALLGAWIHTRVLDAFEGRILPVDLQVARQCAVLHVPNPLEDRDSLIAATALVHDMTVVTRNVSHFEPTGVRILNPWEA
jgi:toxin FitB